MADGRPPHQRGAEMARASRMAQPRELLHPFPGVCFAQRAAALLLYYPLISYGADSRLEGVQIGF